MERDSVLFSWASAFSKWNRTKHFYPIREFKIDIRVRRIKKWEWAKKSMIKPLK